LNLFISGHYVQRQITVAYFLAYTLFRQVRANFTV